jgi:hypothetical protein
MANRRTSVKRPLKRFCHFSIGAISHPGDIGITVNEKMEFFKAVGEVVETFNFSRFPEIVPERGSRFERAGKVVWESVTNQNNEDLKGELGRNETPKHFFIGWRRQSEYRLGKLSLFETDLTSQIVTALKMAKPMPRGNRGAFTTPNDQKDKHCILFQND